MSAQVGVKVEQFTREMLDCANNFEFRRFRL